MIKFLSLILLTSSLFGQLNVYTNIEHSKKKFNSNNFIQISLAVIKELEKEVHKNAKVKLHSLKTYKDTINNTLFLGFPTKSIEEKFKIFQPIISKKHKLYGNRYEIYYIDTLEDAKSAKQIYCKYSDLTENIFKKNNFQNINYVKKSSTGLKSLLKQKERLWLNSDWEMGKLAKLVKIDIQDIKPVLELKDEKQYLMFPKNIDINTYQKYTDAYITIKNNGTLNEIIQKWGKRLNLKLELNSHGISVVE